MSAAPTEDESIETILKYVLVERPFGIIRGYDIIFTDKGIIFLLVEGALSIGLRTGIPAGISGGMGGGAPSGEGIFIGGLIGSYLLEQQHRYNCNPTNQSDVTLKILFNDNKNNFYIPYTSIKKVIYKNKYFNGKFIIYCHEGKIRCEFSYLSINDVKKGLTQKLGEKIDKNAIHAIDKAIERFENEIHNVH